MKRFTGTNRRRSTGQQPGTKSDFRPADKPLVKRGFRSSMGLHRISLVRSYPSASRAARPRPAPTPRRAPSRPDPPVVCSGLGFDKFVFPVSFQQRFIGSKGKGTASNFSTSTEESALQKLFGNQNTRRISCVLSSLSLAELVVSRFLSPAEWNVSRSLPSTEKAYSRAPLTCQI